MTVYLVVAFRDAECSEVVRFFDAFQTEAAAYKWIAENGKWAYHHEVIPVHVH